MATLCGKKIKMIGYDDEGNQFGSPEATMKTRSQRIPDHSQTWGEKVLYKIHMAKYGTRKQKREARKWLHKNTKNKGW